MGAVEEVRQVIQDFLAPDMREIRVRLDPVDKRLEMQDKRFEMQGKRLDTMEEANRARFDSIIQRLEQIQQSFAFDKRLSNLESEKSLCA